MAYSVALHFCKSAAAAADAIFATQNNIRNGSHFFYLPNIKSSMYAMALLVGLQYSHDDTCDKTLQMSLLQIYLPPSDPRRISVCLG